MANITVDYERIRQTAQQLDTGRDQLTQQVEDLNRIIGALVADGFATTAASGAYQDTFNTYAQGAKETIRGLEGLAQFLRKTAETLQSTDEGIAAAIR
ncbi:WXG100 family type VII secretion target [Salinibacterium sp.]|uniref:WXG100 family type VII secretion target n=1 Tax=Salinibacterium sp. TaxID=1915057 RepID=UPI00286BA7DF|nr:WXG100 family type VII secretion target [Salinibacterium sp.]